MVNLLQILEALLLGLAKFIYNFISTHWVENCKVWHTSFDDLWFKLFGTRMKHTSQVFDYTKLQMYLPKWNYN